MKGGRRAALLALCVAVSGLLFLNAWQGYRYHALAQEVSALERAQKDLLERNRQAIADIAREQSPQQVEKKAGDSVEPLDPSHITRVPVGGAVQQPARGAVQQSARGAVAPCSFSLLPRLLSRRGAAWQPEVPPGAWAASW